MFWLNPRVPDRAPLPAQSQTSERRKRREPSSRPPGAPTAHHGVPGGEPKLALPEYLLPTGWLTCLHGPGVTRVPHVDHQGVWIPTTGFQELAEVGRREGYAAAAAPGAPGRRKGQEPEHRRPARGDRGDQRGGAQRGTASGHLAPDAPRGPALWTRRLSRGAQLAGRARGRGAGQQGEVVQNLSLRRARAPGSASGREGGGRGRVGGDEQAPLAELPRPGLRSAALGARRRGVRGALAGRARNASGEGARQPRGRAPCTEKRSPGSPAAGARSPGTSQRWNPRNARLRELLQPAGQKSCTFNGLALERFSFQGGRLWTQGTCLERDRLEVEKGR